MLCLSTRAQVKDSVVHSPTKAWLLSAVVPGLGQAYNKNYWKIPVIYGGFVAFSYFIQTNNFRYKLYQKEFNTRFAIQELDKDKTVEGYEAERARLESELRPQLASTQQDRLKYYKDLYRRDRDFFIILTSLFYMLNMVDAAVDAHFFTYDVSNDLTLQWQPYVNEPAYASTMKPALGLNFSITF
ncbi:MAG: DUF5683 domain-containing protein [Prevotellaceae bacterium]|jgi:hypothetical protein|nr:DUF5683 domain-containing protein [Prevotellaceae bacterium]